MHDAIAVKRGAVPWRPADDAELVIEYDRLDVPTIGVVRQAGTEYLFRCVSGHGSTVSFWTYGRIDDAHRARLEAADGAKAFDEALAHAAFFPAVITIAVDGFGVVDAETVDDA